MPTRVQRPGLYPPAAGVLVSEITLEDLQSAFHLVRLQLQWAGAYAADTAAASRSLSTPLPVCRLCPPAANRARLRKARSG